MSRTTLPRFFTTLVLLAVALPGHAQVTVRREAAGAFFEHRDATGCVVTRVDIAGLREYSAGQDDLGPATSLAETFISRRNECMGQELLRASDATASESTSASHEAAAGAWKPRWKPRWRRLTSSERSVSEMTSTRSARSKR